MAKDEVQGQGPGTPNQDTVNSFHKYSDLDASELSQHHTIGPTQFQAASGSHMHNGSDSELLLTPFEINGSDTDSKVASIISILSQMGATDRTT